LVGTTRVRLIRALPAPTTAIRCEINPRCYDLVLVSSDYLDTLGNRAKPKQRDAPEPPATMSLIQLDYKAHNVKVEVKRKISGAYIYTDVTR